MIRLYDILLYGLLMSQQNDEQKFTFENLPPVTRVKVLFPEGTDFYGRIIIYKLDLLGKAIES